ncbi:MAG: M6 family metalloprotease domain-containing protein [Phycisphaerae bacterium]|nr:M6 family metalloprotease domain-containing protein [Phycisphaerae bacterium]NUQ45205.1 M6 family metalloprotease domain-containing protein [Phycisphaerae bacterium]
METRCPRALAFRSWRRIGDCLAPAALIVAVATPARAVPAPDAPATLRQPDGTVITLRVRGDEWVHWFEDMAGYTVVRDGAGRYVYAVLDGADELRPTQWLVGRDDPKAAGLRLRILAPPDVLRARRDAVRQAGLAGAPATPPAHAHGHDADGGDESGEGDGGDGGEPFEPRTGVLRQLVILCRFSDHGSGQIRAPGNYDVLFNNLGPHPSLAPTGSVRDYYVENSYGQVTIQSTIVGWFVLPQTQAFYANGSSGLRGAYPRNAQRMVEDALAAADPTVDFSQFDKDGNGFVDLLTVVHSGYGAEWGGSGNRIWSHMWGLPSAWTSGEGTQVATYCTVPALHGSSGSTLTRIGIVVHEMGHLFGLPDLYDIDYTSKGVGAWCGMADSWGFFGNGLWPAHFSAWCKMRLGYLTPQVVTPPQTVAVGLVESVPAVFRVDAGFPQDEYLLIENRQKVGFDTINPTSGLAVWHIDDRKWSNTDEGYPAQAGWPWNNQHYRVALLQAHGAFLLERNIGKGTAGDLYRGGYRTELSPATNPNTNGYQFGARRVTNNVITNISNSAAVMLFDLRRCWAPCSWAPTGAVGPGFFRGVMAFDMARARTLLIGDGPGPSPVQTWSWDGFGWTQLPTGPLAPSVFTAAAMTYDISRDRMVVFGPSSSGGAPGQTWEFDGAAWSQVFPANSPSARSGHGMVYDEARQRVVLFGGNDATSGAFLNDTWEWNGVNWTLRNPSNRPSVRSGHAMAYDRRRQVTVLYGGAGFTGIHQTWEWNGSNWNNRSTSENPFTRVGAGMAYDERRGVCVLYGGNIWTQNVATWEWNGRVWRQMGDAGPGPRTLPAMAFDRFRGRTVLFGGATPGGAATDTWTYPQSLTQAAYIISGSSSGRGWSWSISGPGGMIRNRFCSGIRRGRSAADLAARWVDSINEQRCAGVQAVVLPNFPTIFVISASGPPGLSLCVGNYGQTPGCCMPPGTFCTFNPTVTPIELSNVDCDGNGMDDTIDLLFGNADCNGDGLHDACFPPGADIPDCNTNGIGDLCEDCNGNGLADACELPPDGGGPGDCNADGILDECQSGDCNTNGASDICDIVNGIEIDLNGDWIPDICQDCDLNGIPDPDQPDDCNDNDVPDSCDIAPGGGSFDCNGDGIPDECQDCNTNLLADDCDIAAGTSADCNTNLVPDECEVAAGTALDDDGNGVLDVCYYDCNHNAFDDALDIAGGTSGDCNGDGVPDECQADCNLNGAADECDIANGVSVDANLDGVPDECAPPCPSCPGDVNLDAAIDGEDVQEFVACLFVTEQSSACWCAELTGDGMVGGDDALLFVEILLNESGAGCPRTGG